MAAFLLVERCPRLARARDQRRVEMRLERDERRFVRDKLESAERCVAHRELQLARSFSTGNGRYMLERQAKLGEAKRKLAGLQKWAEQIGAVA